MSKFTTYSECVLDIGPMNQVPAMDYTGATAAGLAGGMPLVFLTVTALLMGGAVAGRRRQLAG